MNFKEVIKKISKYVNEPIDITNLIESALFTHQLNDALNKKFKTRDVVYIKEHFISPFPAETYRLDCRPTLSKKKKKKKKKKNSDRQLSTRMYIYRIDDKNKKFYNFEDLKRYIIKNL